MSEEGAKFCQFGLNGNPRDFLCSPLPPYLHSMIHFYPFLRLRGGGCAETARVRRRISPCTDLENLFLAPPFRFPFRAAIQRCREIE